MANKNKIENTIKFLLLFSDKKPSQKALIKIIIFVSENQISHEISKKFICNFKFLGLREDNKQIIYIITTIKGLNDPIMLKDFIDSLMHYHEITGEEKEWRKEIIRNIQDTVSEAELEEVKFYHHAFELNPLFYINEKTKRTKSADALKRMENYLQLNRYLIELKNAQDVFSENIKNNIKKLLITMNEEDAKFLFELSWFQQFKNLRTDPIAPEQSVIKLEEKVTLVTLSSINPDKYRNSGFSAFSYLHSDIAKLSELEKQNPNPEGISIADRADSKEGAIPKANLCQTPNLSQSSLNSASIPIIQERQDKKVSTESSTPTSLLIKSLVAPEGQMEPYLININKPTRVAPMEDPEQPGGLPIAKNIFERKPSVPSSPTQSSGFFEPPVEKVMLLLNLSEKSKSKENPALKTYVALCESPELFPPEMSEEMKQKMLDHLSALAIQNDKMAVEINHNCVLTQG